MSGHHGPLLLYGPDRLPMHPSTDATEQRWGYRPFHGIVSSALRDHPGCTPARWLAGAATLDAPHPHDPELAAAAGECGVLTFDESLAAAREAAARYARPGGAVLTELWHVKEGHTSSVWQATLDDDGATDRVAVNVPRDAVADCALTRTATVYTRLSAALPAVAPATVLSTVPLGPPLTAEAPGTAGPRGRARGTVRAVVQRWLDGARELNALPTAGGTRLVAVDRFLPDDADPARIGAVRGRSLTVAEHEAVGHAVGNLLRTTALRSEESWLLPGFDIHHGDWVWWRGRAAVVACRPERTRLRGELEAAVRHGVQALCARLDGPFLDAVLRGAAGGGSAR
ncbi:hypothetical protein AA0Y32_10215 [Georgenia phoenicis]|uniref:hypothetical protein n=1 Tax=unclassified Georgenia TaxID=2626815 RepID=UPI0039AFAFDA